MDFNQAKLNPASEFRHPAEVVSEPSFTKDQKLAVLRQWEYDVREMEVAEDENMQGGSRVALRDVLNALDEVDPDREEQSSPNKQGGE
ncbi:hypothetical protein F6455_16585 [Proteobacteria bacterium 005FR1]|nr:hypothetical protein [Proteobacteria bacterium 005FR1]